MKEHCLAVRKVRSKRHSEETITDAHYADDLAFLANTPVQIEFQQHGLEQAVKTDKTEFMCFK